MTDLKQLIERLEQATGPDSNLDTMIADWHWRAKRKEPFSWYPWTVPAYTRSLDAAMQLVPRAEGVHWPWVTMSTSNPNDPKGCNAMLWLDNHRKVHGQAPTLALALCIAALRAREGETS